MHPRLVLIEMVREVGELHTRIEATLGEEPEALAAWKAFDNGFMYAYFFVSLTLIVNNESSQGMAPFIAAIQAVRARIWVDYRIVEADTVKLWSLLSGEAS
jgi:hypothetical protein